jgi:hypothetical protein
MQCKKDCPLNCNVKYLEIVTECGGRFGMSSASGFNFVCTFFAIDLSSFLMAKTHRHSYKSCPCQKLTTVDFDCGFGPHSAPPGIENCDVA